MRGLRLNSPGGSFELEIPGLRFKFKGLGFTSQTALGFGEQGRAVCLTRQCLEVQPMYRMIGFRVQGLRLMFQCPTRPGTQS